jgi:hypothetical protein
MTKGLAVLFFLAALAFGALALKDEWLEADASNNIWYFAVASVMGAILWGRHKLLSPKN